jgi:hypothetical protein
MNRRTFILGVSAMTSAAALYPPGIRNILRLRNLSHGRRMARAPQRCRIPRPARSRHRTPLFQPPRCRDAGRHLPVSRLRSARLWLGREIRQWHRLAELLRKPSARNRHAGGPPNAPRPDRGALPPLRWASGPCLQRRPATHRQAPLHQRRQPALRGHGLIRQLALVEGATSRRISGVPGDVWDVSVDDAGHLAHVEAGEDGAFDQRALHPEKPAASRRPHRRAHRPSASGRAGHRGRPPPDRARFHRHGPLAARRRPSALRRRCRDPSRRSRFRALCARTRSWRAPSSGPRRGPDRFSASGPCRPDAPGAPASDPPARDGCPSR